MSGEPTPETRGIVLGRDMFRCARCGRGVEFCAFSIHHRRLRSHPFDGLHEASNLITLCGTGTTGCHGWVHANPQLAYEHGWLVHAWQDPKRVPIDHAKWGWCYLWDDGTVATIPETLAAMADLESSILSECR